MNFEVKWREKPGSVLCIKTSQRTWQKLTHIFEGLDYGTLVKIFKKLTFNCKQPYIHS